MNIDALAVVKNTTTIVVSLGVGKIIRDIVKNNTVVATTTENLAVHAGSLVLGSMVADAAADHALKRIDKFVSTAKELREEFRKNSETEKE